MLALAIIPSIILFIIIWRSDKIEKEPPKLLWKLFGFGALTTISAVILENIGASILSLIFPEASIIYMIIDNFLIVALAEEAGKFFVLKKTTWKNPAFNYTFDAVVYSVTASLGFATVENIIYVLDGGFGVAVTRALLSVPGHVIDAIYMGYYYGLAKHAEAYNDSRLAKKHLKKALFVPVLIHGFYDFCLDTDIGLIYLVFFIFEIVITILAIRQTRRLSNIHVEIPSSTEPSANSSADNGQTSQ